MRSVLWPAMSGLLLMGIAACDSPDTMPGDANTPATSLSLEIWGEQYCETGLPASIFDDGYSVVFDKFLVSLSSATVEGEGLAPAIDISDATVWDLVKAGPHVISTVSAPPGTYDQSSFKTAAATSASTSGNVDNADLQRMIDGGYVYYVSGSATLDATTKTFHWGFTADKIYQCDSVGILEAGGSTTVQMTLHVDHVFTTNLSNFKNRFTEIAEADSNGDGEVTQAELEMVTDGYDGGQYFTANNLWDYLNKESTFLGHVDGENECI